MAKADIWMPFYVADYLADTMHLSPAEHGAYLLLILHYWKSGPLPDDDARLALITRMGGEWLASAGTIKAFFTITDGTLTHRRIDRERAHAQDNRQKKVISGVSGARAKWGNTANQTRAERLANARHLATHSADEWSGIKQALPGCAKCGAAGDIVKDHITPIYQGGSDGIENIQPLCRSCNSSKGPDATDYRPKDWRERLAKCLPNACEMPDPSPSPSPSIKAKSKASALATRLPADWVPSDADLAFCQTKRPDLSPPDVADSFRDYWIAVPGARGRKEDWPATWRNWVRNQGAKSNGANHGKNGSSRAGRVSDTIAELTGANRHPSPVIPGTAERVD